MRLETRRGRGTDVEIAKFGSRGTIPTTEEAVARWRGATLLIDGIRDVHV